jgi:ABC-type nitrate/sulfonate/bicarbonate transport system permease component
MARLDEAGEFVPSGRGDSNLKAVVGTVLAVLSKFGSIVVLLLAWEILASSGVFTPFLLPKFSVVIERIAADMAAGVWFTNIGLTLYRAIVGFSAAVVIGVPLGILMARQSTIRWFFDPVVSIGFPAPKVAFLPIFILWFDLFDTAKIVLVGFTAIFPIVAASWAGTFTVDKHFIWSARSLGASNREVLAEIILPAAMPQILTGLQIALPISMIVALVTEFLMGGQGLGGAMIEAQRFGDSPGVFAGIVSIAIAGIIMIKSLEYLRRRLLSWHSETETATA